MNFANSHICDRLWKIMMAKIFLKYLYRWPRYNILNFWPLGGFSEASTNIFSFLTFNFWQSKLVNYSTIFALLSCKKKFLATFCQRAEISSQRWGIKKCKENFQPQILWWNPHLINILTSKMNSLGQKIVK